MCKRIDTESNKHNFQKNWILLPTQLKEVKFLPYTKKTNQDRIVCKLNNKNHKSVFDNSDFNKQSLLFK